MFFNTLNTSLHTLVCLISEEKYDVIISLFLFLLASVNIFFLSLIFCSLNICPDVVVLLLGIYTVLCSLNTKVYGLLFILFRLKQSSPPLLSLDLSSKYIWKHSCCLAFKENWDGTLQPKIANEVVMYSKGENLSVTLIKRKAEDKGPLGSTSFQSSLL